MKTEKQLRLGGLADAIERSLDVGHIDDDTKQMLRRLYGHLAKTSREKSAQYWEGFKEGRETGYQQGMKHGFEEGKIFLAHENKDPLK